MPVGPCAAPFFALACLLAACESSHIPDPGVSVQVWAEAQTVEVGATMQLEAVVVNAADTVLLWRSSDVSIASVSASGLVTGVAPGQAVITATARADTRKRATIPITVVLPVFVEVSAESQAVDLGATMQLKAHVANAADTAVLWRSSNVSVASVSASGLVTGVAPGQVVITATARADTTKRATITITVVPPMVIRLEADTYAVSVGTPAQFSAVVTSRDGGAVPGAPVRWSTYYLVYAADASYDTVWDHPLEPAVTTTDARGVAVLSYAVPLSLKYSPPNAFRIVARLADGATDTTEIKATIPPESPTGLQWTALPGMPWTRAGMAAAAHGDRIYLLGGYCHGAHLGILECTPSVPNPGQPVAFTPATGTWDVLPLPDSLTLPARGGLAADLPDGIHLLAPGRHLLFVPETGGWSARTPAWPDTLPRPALLVAVQGRLYAISETGDLRTYDPATNAWSVGRAMPRAPGWSASGAAAGVLGGQIYVAGGGGYFDQGRQLTRYDPATDAWTALPDMPFGRSNIAAGAVAGRFCVFGGAFNTFMASWAFGETYCYDPATNAWLLGPPPAAPIGLVGSGMAAVTLGDRVYAFGGAEYLYYRVPEKSDAGAAVLAPR